MTTTADQDTTRNGRFARNLALSISGGAILTLLGASAAHAEDLSDAGTTSDGAAKAHSGDATAVGNQSGTDATQGVGSGSGGGLQVVNQQANAANVGVAVANTGGNVAVGNSSGNTATGTQDGVNGLGPVVNSGTASNSSNGSASISTGNASAIGNQSTTSIKQASDGAGVLGGILIVSQDAFVVNSGVALSNTGLNTANGNESVNEATLLQDANLLAGLASNSGSASNSSDGKATISTGNASAVGNKSDSAVIQSSTGAADGDLGGLLVVDQVNLTANLGAAVANTGDNDATGNASGSNSTVDQIVGEFVPSLTGVGSNSGEASNDSDGTATIVTGDATAVGNDSHTTIDQTTDLAIDELGAAIAAQATSVLNVGVGVADTGGNGAQGNVSSNTAGVDQDMSGDTPVFGVQSNSASGSNASDGTATIVTGDAWATGNASTSNVSQASEADSSAFNLLPQVSGVQNAGLAVATTGDNGAQGNASTSTTDLLQEVAVNDAPAVNAPVAFSNSADASSSSDGAASIRTGDASAKGNVSTTALSQDLDPSGLVLPVQVADVVNVGIGIADTGGNEAQGNGSTNTADAEQNVDLGAFSNPDVTITALGVVGSSSADLANASDGSASIATGDASATGNESTTTLTQRSNGEIDGLGLVLNTQVAAVANVGLAEAATGGNGAQGNGSTNDFQTVNGNPADQDVNIGSENFGGDTTLLAGSIIGSNQLELDNSSDGTGSVSTGDATAAGNKSATTLAQTADGSVDGAGGVINTQAGIVVNAGLGEALTGGNSAAGNSSVNLTTLGQDTSIGSNNNNGDTDITAASILASNSGRGANTSDGSGSVTTGDADATGNASTTHLTQVTGGEVDGLGLVIGTQVAPVVNVGVAGANTGGNGATGNVSGNDASVHQDARIGTNVGGDLDLLVVGPLVGSNSGEASSTSDGSAEVTTGSAEAHGNVSSTDLTQDPEGTVDGLGLVIGTQVAGVANVGAAIADTGGNGATGNQSFNGNPATVLPDGASLDQYAGVGSDNGDAVDITVIGPLAASNSGSATNDSDGHAKVKTGSALATGNVSTTNLTQGLTGGVEETGLVIGTQAAGVANIGIASADTGDNRAIGNESQNLATTTQDASIASQVADPAEFTAIGPVVASNSGTAASSSDGEACVCTGDAVASGNLSTTSLDQDLDLSSGGGLVLLTEAGGVLNLGLGVADTGGNLATGNTSSNTATTTQSSTINDAVSGLVGPQVANDSGGASNSSDGTAKVASGNATATGNLSTTAFAQAAAAASDGTPTVATLSGGTANAGLGLATTGDNVGIGNDSVNVATLTQTADGAGIVSNQGEATNDSDGTATIGDPSDCDDVTPGETPGTPGLPKTGSELEAEAAIALMLLLVGFGLRRRGQQLA